MVKDISKLISLVLQPEYQDKIRNAIKETVDLNKNANPNTLWEKNKIKKEIQLKEEINKIKNNLYINERQR